MLSPDPVRFRPGSPSSSDGSSEYGGYVNTRYPQTTNYEACIRCHKKVYPAEAAEIGVPLHRNCFRCVECNSTLTLNTYIIARPDNSSGNLKAVYCRAHAPKPLRHELDDQAVGIKNAVNAQRIIKQPSFSDVIRLSDTTGWEYDPQAVEFQHAKALFDRNRKQKARPPEIQDPLEEDYEKGEVWRRLREGQMERDSVKDMANSFGKQGHKFPTNTDYMEPNALWSPAKPEDPFNPTIRPTGFKRSDSKPAHHEKKWTDNDRETIKGNGNHSNDCIYERLHVIRAEPRQERMDLPPPLPAFPPPSLAPPIDKSNFSDVMKDLYRSDPYHQYYLDKAVPSISYHDDAYMTHRERHIDLRDGYNERPKDYFKEKQFIQQNQLELRQRHEHFEMFREFEKMREEEICHVEKDIKRQMEEAVKDVIRQMDTAASSEEVHQERLNVEQHFQHLKEEQLRHIMDKCSNVERRRLDDMIDKQAREMLELIDKKVPANLPSPKPPRSRKRDLYAGPYVFDDLDFQAVQLALHDQGSFTELVYELTRNCSSQLEKARSIFRWITVKDLNKMMFREELTEDSPYFFLKGIKYGIESYHELFKRLCSYAGLKVKIIRGVSKSAGYRPGMEFGDNRFRNTWAAVYIDGSWRFIDCHWGSRHVTKSQEVAVTGKFCYELDEFFFLTDPEDHIYMHYPDDMKWQLLDRSVGLEEFIKFPLVKSTFFHYGLKFGSRVSSVLETTSGTVEVVLVRCGNSPLAFNTRLEVDDESMDGYCIHKLHEDEVIFNLSLPRKGSLLFTIFACDTDKGDIYNNVCSFKIICSHVENKPFCKFPKLPHGYGPTPLASELGMAVEKYDEHYLVCNEDKMVLNIHFKQPVKVSHKLMARSFDDTNDFLNRMVFARYRDNNYVSYLIRFPERGVYVFSLFASNLESASPVLECACRYLIQCNINPPSPPRSYPKMQQYWLKCRLHEPTAGDLKVNKNVKFKVEVTNADAVAVIVGHQWYYLKREDDEGKLWEGIAFTGKDTVFTVDVYGRFNGNRKDFFPLLEYRLVED